MVMAGEENQYVCEMCGNLVRDKETHDKWHADLLLMVKADEESVKKQKELGTYEHTYAGSLEGNKSVVVNEPITVSVGKKSEVAKKK
jgi:hypothetical protein